jgi:hypothetical protein
MPYRLSNVPFASPLCFFIAATTSTKESREKRSYQIHCSLVVEILQAVKAVSIVADSRHSSQNLNYSNCNDSVSSHRYTRHLSGTNFCSIMHAAAAAAAAAARE